MSFTTFTSGSKTYESRGPGIYSEDSVAFGGLTDEVRLRANSNKKTPNVSITRYQQHTVTDGTTTRRVPVIVSTTINYPADSGISMSDVSAMVTDIANVSTAANLSRMFQGES